MTALPDPDATLEVSCENVAGWLDHDLAPRPLLIDCREPEEWDLCRIEGAELVPLGEFPRRADDLIDRAQHGIVIYCHHGMRSLRAAAFLRQAGLESTFSMAGGIDAWSRIIDPNVPRY